MATPRFQFPDIDMPEVAPSVGAASTAIMQLAQLVGQDSLRRDTLSLERTRLEGEQRRQEFDQILQLREQQSKDRQMEIQQAAQALQMTAQMEMQAIQLKAATKALEKAERDSLRQEAEQAAGDRLTPKIQALNIAAQSGDTLGAALRGRQLQNDPDLRVANEVQQQQIAEAAGAAMKLPVGRGVAVADALRLASSGSGEARIDALAQLAAVGSPESLGQLQKEFGVKDVEWKEVLRVRDSKYTPEKMRRTAEFEQKFGAELDRMRAEALATRDEAAMQDVEDYISRLYGSYVNGDPLNDPRNTRGLSMAAIQDTFTQVDSKLFNTAGMRGVDKKEFTYADGKTARGLTLEGKPETVLGYIGDTLADTFGFAGATIRGSMLQRQFAKDKVAFTALVTAVRENDPGRLTDAQIQEGLLAAARIEHLTSNRYLEVPQITLVNAVGGSTAIDRFNRSLKQFNVQATTVPGGRGISVPQQPQSGAATGSVM